MANSTDNMDGEINRPRSIQFIQYANATNDERADVRFIPKLEINPDALDIIAERFEAPISVIAFVGNVGVGKSKLASLTVEALHNQHYLPPLQPFISSAGNTSLTNGIWMWDEPLKHPDANKKGSILVLDCEGMNGENKNINDNLYLFCLFVSTAFALVLRPTRIDDGQFDRLYRALDRFKKMGACFSLPNFWLVATETPLFVVFDSKIKADVEVSKQEWIRRAFRIDEDALSNRQADPLETRKRFIEQFLPYIDCVNLHRLPESLQCNDDKLDLYTTLRNESSENYYGSLKVALSALLSNHGCGLLGLKNKTRCISPTELASIMQDLVDSINENKMTCANILIERYLSRHFQDHIVTENIEEFKEALFRYADEVIGDRLRTRRILETEVGTEETNAMMERERRRLTEHYIGLMIRSARYLVYGIDDAMAPSYVSKDEQKEALRGLPNSAQERVRDVEKRMDEYRDPELLIDRIRAEIELVEETKASHEKQRNILRQEKLINASLRKGQLASVGVAPCIGCGRRGGKINIIHDKSCCHSGHKSNYYVFAETEKLVVCNGCRCVQDIYQLKIVCNKCGKRRKVTRYYGTEENK